jgi:hypothetical protein
MVKPSEDEVTGILDEIYYGLGHEGAFAGPRTLHDVARRNGSDVTLAQVNTYLETQSSYALYHKRRRNWPKNTTLLQGPGRVLAADIWFLNRFSADNDGINAIFIAIDCFSKLIYCIILDDERGRANVNKITQDAAINCLTEIFNLNTSPFILTDNDSCFTGAKCQRFFNDNGKVHLTSKNVSHAFPAERAIQSIATKLLRAMHAANTNTWLEILPQIVQ